MELEKQYNYFKEHQEEFLREHYGKVVMITDSLMVDFYDDMVTAVKDSWAKYGMGHSFVQMCTHEALQPSKIGVVWS